MILNWRVFVQFPHQIATRDRQMTYSNLRIHRILVEDLQKIIRNHEVLYILVEGLLIKVLETLTVVGGLPRVVNESLRVMVREARGKRLELREEVN